MGNWKLIYIVEGIDRRYSTMTNYGEYEDRRDAAVRMEELKRSFGNIVRFRIVEEYRQYYGAETVQA